MKLIYRSKRARLNTPQRAKLACSVYCIGLMAVTVARASTTETVLHNFAAPPHGANPVAGVNRDAAGNLYGTTQYGGASGAGVVYKLDTALHQSVLYSFTGGADGGYPRAGVIRDGAGNLYGTTYLGGASGAGVVYKLDTTLNEAVLYSFTGGLDGANPFAGVIRNPAGNLYGTTTYGGASGAGVVYRLDTTGHELVLHSFTGGDDGGYPESGVIPDATGALYGTTLFGGAENGGVVFKLTP